MRVDHAHLVTGQRPAGEVDVAVRRGARDVRLEVQAQGLGVDRGEEGLVVEEGGEVDGEGGRVDGLVCEEGVLDAGG